MQQHATRLFANLASLQVRLMTFHCRSIRQHSVQYADDMFHELYMIAMVLKMSRVAKLAVVSCIVSEGCHVTPGCFCRRDFLLCSA